MKMTDKFKKNKKKDVYTISEYYYIKEHTMLDGYSLAVFCVYKNENTGEFIDKMIEDFTHLGAQEQEDLIKQIKKELNIVPHEESKYFTYSQEKNKQNYDKKINEKMEKLKTSIEKNKNYSEEV